MSEMSLKRENYDICCFTTRSKNDCEQQIQKIISCNIWADTRNCLYSGVGDFLHSKFIAVKNKTKKAQTASSDLRWVDVCLVSPPQRWACGGRRVTGVFTSGSGSRHLPNWNQVAAIKQRRKHTTLGLCNTFRFIPSLVCPLEPTARVLSLTLSFSPRSLINKIKPGIVKRVNRLPTPIAGLVSLFSFCSAVNSCVEH